MTQARQNKPPTLSTPLNLSTILRTALIWAAYLVLFTVIDHLALAFQIYPGVVAWYPPDGLSFALLLVLAGASYPW
jgi:hypothetical protein